MSNSCQGRVATTSCVLPVRASSSASVLASSPISLVARIRFHHPVGTVRPNSYPPPPSLKNQVTSRGGSPSASSSPASIVTGSSNLTVLTGSSKSTRVTNDFRLSQ